MMPSAPKQRLPPTSKYIFFNITFYWLTGNFISCTPITLISSPSISPRPGYLASQKRKIKNKKIKTLKSNLCYLYTHWSMAKFSVAWPWKRPESSPPTSKAIICIELHFNIYITPLKGSLQWIPVLDHYFGDRGYHKNPSMSLCLSCTSAVINIPV